VRHIASAGEVSPTSARRRVLGGRPVSRPALVERVARIRRQAVIAGGQPISAFVDGPDALVAIAAERAQRPEHELAVIALMRRVVIGDGGRRDATLLLAHGAQRGSRKLVLGPPPPGLERVPGPPRQRLGGSEIASVHVVEGALDPQPRQENGARASLSRA
jgi:hypothetical protein